MEFHSFVYKYFPGAQLTDFDTYTTLCPVHNDHTPSLVISDKGNKTLINCPVCTMNHETHKAFMEKLVYMLPNSKDFWKDLVGEKNSNITNEKTGKWIRDYTLDDYSKDKKLPIDILKTYGCKTEKYINKKGFDTGTQCVHIEYFDVNNQYLNYRNRVFIEKEGKSKVISRKGSNNFIYGLWKVPEYSQKVNPNNQDLTPYLIVCEGESDCHTLWFAGFNAIGFPGCGNFSDIDKAFQEQGILQYMHLFKAIFVVMEDNNGRKALYPPFRKCSFNEKVKCIQFRPDIDIKGDGTPGNCKDPSELFCAFPDDNVKKFQEEMRRILENAVPIDNYPYPIEEQTPIQGKDDRRKISSKENGNKGGRPIADYLSIAKRLMENKKINTFRIFKGQYYKWNEKENRFRQSDSLDFLGAVTGALQELQTQGELEKCFNIQSLTVSTRNNVCMHLQSTGFLLLDSEEVKENKFISNPNDDKLYIAVGNGILSVREMAIMMAEHENKNEININEYFFPKTIDFLNFNSMNNVYFDINATCPKTDKILTDLLPDEEMRKVYWEMLAIALLEDYKPNKLYLLYGPPGTGKSTTGLGIIQALYGNSCVQLKWEDLNLETGKFKIHFLAENNIAIIDELPTHLKNLSPTLSFIKDVTNGKEINTERKGENAVSSNAKALLVFATNSPALLLQAAKNKEIAVFDRVIPILFQERFRGKEEENRQIEKIFNEETSGIFNKALCVLGGLINNDYKMFIAQKSDELLNDIKEKGKNTFLHFIDDYCIKTNSTSYPISSLYSEYKKVMEKLGENERDILKSREFSSELCTVPGVQFSRDENTRTEFVNYKPKNDEEDF